MRSLGVVGKDVSPEDYALTKAYLSSLPGAGKALALKGLAAKIGEDPAALALAKETFQTAETYMKIRTLVGKGDYQAAGALFGELSALRDKSYRTLQAVHGDPELAKYATNLEAQGKTLNELAKFTVNKAVGDLMAGKTTLGTVNSLIKSIASVPEGKRFLQKHLTSMALGAIDERQARILQKMALNSPNPKLKVLTFKKGDVVPSVTFGYDPNKGEVTLKKIPGEGAFTLNAADIRSGGKEDRSITIDDSTRVAHGTSIKSWRGGKLVVQDGNKETKYMIQSAGSFSYDPKTKQFEIHGARVQDKDGLTYIADFEGTGEIIGSETAPMGIKTSLDKLAIEKFQNAHDPQVPVFGLTPQKALALAEDKPGALANELVRYKDNPLLANAYIREFSTNLAKGIAAQYGKPGHQESVGHEESKKGSWISEIGASISSALGFSAEEGMDAHKELASRGQMTFTGKTGLKYERATTDKHGETASWGTEIIAAAVSKTLKSGVDAARKEQDDDYIGIAVTHVISAVNEAEAKAYKGLSDRTKLERKEGSVDIQGVTSTEKLTGKLVKVPRSDEIDVRGGNAGDQVPYVYVSQERFQQIREDWNKYSDGHTSLSKREVIDFMKQYDLTMEQRAAIISEIVHRGGIGRPNFQKEN